VIRPAAHADVPALVDLLGPFFEASQMATVAPWCPDSLAASLRSMIDTPAGILLAAWVDGVPVAVAGAMVVPVYWNTAALMGQELFWWVLPEHRGTMGPAMLDALEQAARDKGATLFMMVALEALRPDAVGHLYERRGYRALERSYVRVL
jgi:GNAT superfamily N-acetyltransferase